MRSARTSWSSSVGRVSGWNFNRGRWVHRTLTYYQLPFGYDPGPTFFLTDAAGAVYWPDGPMANPINYYYKGYKTMGDISTHNAGWMNTATIFRVPSGIRQPTLVTITWQGGDRYEFAGVRLD